MQKKTNRKTAYLTIAAALVALLLVSVATYAWFTSNQSVRTTRADARTGQADVQLLISEYGGSQFTNAISCYIPQVNQANREYLLPVSTADLTTFLFNSMTPDGFASSFSLDTNEEHIFHGRVYLKAQMSGENISRKMAVYLEKSTTTGGELVQGGNGLLQRAGRLGISVEGQQPTIFSLTTQQSDASQQARNTKVNGEVLQDGYVLTYANNTVTPVLDPALPLQTYVVDGDQPSATYPDKPLFVLDNGQIYPVDIYFYLEGCDPDCSDAVSLDGLDLHLAFFGVVQ